MSGEAIGRWFVGIGFLWVVVVLVVGLLGGLDKPWGWVGFLADVSGWNVIRLAYQVLTFVVVPIGMLVYIKDVLGDPVAVWVKFAAPGAMAAVYMLFLAAAQPDLGRGMLRSVETMVPAAAGFGTGVEATGGWVVRFLAWLALLAGIPAVIGAVIGLFTGGGRPRYRP
jgi:hypothetical protein